jgi:hypothetical protein
MSAGKLAAELPDRGGTNGITAWDSTHGRKDGRHLISLATTAKLDAFTTEDSTGT